VEGVAPVLEVRGFFMHVPGFRVSDVNVDKINVYNVPSVPWFSYYWEDASILRMDRMG
jgi:hypothetical protein